MTGATAYAKATTTLPSTKPVLRIFQDAVRAAVNRVDADGKTRIFKIAEALVVKAATGDIACIREVADRLDGKAQVIGDDGAVQLSFVVRLPQQADPADWAKTINGVMANGTDEQSGERMIAAPVGGSMTDASNVWPQAVTQPSDAESMPIDGRSTQSEVNLEASAHSVPPLVAPAPLATDLPDAVSDRTDQ